ncbi:MAG: transposase [Proteobacteria bacterium]|nr:transposase [Pseudomonadota bacterium]
MTAPRFTKIDLNATPYYHCMTRCVRRSFLCGKDAITGKDFEHRKGWIVARIKELSKIFAVKICAYAVMSNHYHIVIFINEKEAKAWSEKEVFQRWSALFPIDASRLASPFVIQDEIDFKISQWRERLMSISWFMRCLNEKIALLSNLEDKCKGRFWECRFKSQALLDEGALLSAMVYVDLNPIRSKVACTPEESEFTSIYERIKEMTKSINKEPFGLNKLKNGFFSKETIEQCDTIKQPVNLMPFASGVSGDVVPHINFKFVDYLHLIDNTGRIIRENKKGAIPEDLSPILTRLGLTSLGWFEMVSKLEQHFFQAVGHVMILVKFGSQFRERGPRGIGAVKQFYIS